MRLRLFVFVVFLTLIPLPAPAAPGPGGTSLERRLPAERLATAFADPSSTASSLARAQAGLLTAPATAGGSDLSVLDRRIDQDVYYKSIASAGDLNDDDADDVLTTEYPMPSFDPDQLPLDYPAASLVARSGPTGAELWRVASHNYAEHLYLYFGVFGTPSAIGGHDRPLIVTLDVTSPGGVRSSVLRQTVSVLDGRDGSIVWTREFVALAAGDTGLTYPLAYAGLIYRIEAIAGEGGDDLLLNVRRPDGANGLVLDGADGSVVGGVGAAAAGVSSLPWIVPATAPHSGGPALLAVSSLGVATSVSLHPIDPGPPYWTATIPYAADAAATPIIRIPVALDAGTYQVDAYFYDGTWVTLVAVIRDGAIAWQDRVPALTDVAGDADGDGTGDVLLIEPTVAGLDLTVLSGPDGGEVWTRVVPIEPMPGGSSRLSACVPCSADLDGDGAAETLAMSVRRGGTTNEWRTRAVRGSDGTDLWRTPPLGAYTEYPFSIGADLTGDGDDDVVGIKVLPGDPQQIRVGVTINRGADFAFLWSQTAIKPAVSGSYQIAVGILPVRLGGQWGVFVALNEFSEERRPDGTVRWRYDPSVHMFADGSLLWSA